MMQKALNRTEKEGRGRRVALGTVFLMVTFQVMEFVLFPIISPGIAEAKTFVVNSTLDETDTNPGDGICASAPSGKCTLRGAIQEANALPGLDVIKLKAGIYVITIPGMSEDACATGDFDINEDLTIMGTGARNTFINGGKLDRVFHIISGSVTIADVAIQNGLVKESGGGLGWIFFGGGIFNEGGDLIIKGVNISNNAVSGGIANYGGGICSAGALKITKSILSGSTISNNAASGGEEARGGGIYSSGLLIIKGSTFTNNIASSAPNCSGGGIFNEGPFTITGSTISSNFASANFGGVSRGGGMFITDSDGTITQSTISNNAALGGEEAEGGGIWKDGTLTDGYITIRGSKISNNFAQGNTFGYGGGICSWGLSSQLTIGGSTISRNAASGRLSVGHGGGIYVGGGRLFVANASKVIRNFSSDQGGGISFRPGGYGDLSADSTVAKNIPDEIYIIPVPVSLEK